MWNRTSFELHQKTREKQIKQNDPFFRDYTEYEKKKKLKKNNPKNFYEVVMWESSRQKYSVIFQASFPWKTVSGV